MCAEKQSEQEVISKEVQSIWNQNAEWWDGKVGEGNDFQKILIGPVSERFLNIQAGEIILDCGCGNGLFSRRMAQLGARVVAFDFSEKFLERAKARSAAYGDKIDYRLIDATDREQLLSLGERKYDAAVCNMTLMDMAEIDPLAEGLGRLLKIGGKVVFSVLHPCFNSSNGCKMVVEKEDKEGQLVVGYSVKVSKYIRPSVAKGLGIVGQPAPHLYFHRPISTLINTFVQTGFVVDGMEEPAFKGETEPDRPLSWANFQEIPPALVVRMRLLERIIK